MAATQQKTEAPAKATPAQIKDGNGEVDSSTSMDLPAIQPPQGKAAGLVAEDNSSFSNLLDTAKFEHMWRVATVFARSGMVPKQYNGKAEACFVAIQMAVRLEVDPFMFMQNTYIGPNGNPSMYGQLAIALVNARGPFRGPIQFRFEGEGKTRACTAFATHRVTGQVCEMEVNLGMAEAEGWKKNNPKWTSIPDLMLRYRSGAWFGRVYAPECLMGMQTVEERIDIGDLVLRDDGTYAPPTKIVAADTAGQQLDNFTSGQPATKETIDHDPETGEIKDETDASSAEQMELAPEDPVESHPYFSGAKRDIGNCVSVENIDAYWLRETKNKNHAALPAPVLSALTTIMQEKRKALGESSGAAK